MARTYKTILGMVAFLATMNGADAWAGPAPAPFDWRVNPTLEVETHRLELSMPSSRFSFTPRVETFEQDRDLFASIREVRSVGGTFRAPLGSGATLEVEGKRNYSPLYSNLDLGRARLSWELGERLTGGLQVSLMRGKPESMRMAPHIDRVVVVGLGGTLHFGP